MLKSISVLLFLVIAVTFILPMTIVVDDAEAERTHKYIIAVWHEFYKDAAFTLYCDSEFATTAKSTVTHEDHPEGTKVHYGSSSIKMVDASKCDDNEDDEDDGDSTTS